MTKATSTSAKTSAVRPVLRSRSAEAPAVASLEIGTLVGWPWSQSPSPSRGGALCYPHPRQQHDARRSLRAGRTSCEQFVAGPS